MSKTTASAAAWAGLTFEVPNLDGLESYDLGRLNYVFSGLAAYCDLREMAIAARKRGAIAEAMEHERRADQIHATLPCWARW
ncbi:MAG: hypothetical protein AB7F75_12925 [Planctomycetota bacterium]